MNPATNLFIALAAGVIALLIGWFVAGLHRRSQLTTEEALGAVNGLKWREFAECTGALFAQRGFTRVSRDHKPGDGGFDMLLLREGKRYLALLKESASYRVDDADLNDFAEVLKAQDAQGGFIVTTGSITAATLNAARRLRIEVIYGDKLWSEIGDHVPQSVTHEAHVMSRESRGRRVVAVGAAGVVVALGSFLALTLYPRAAPPPRVAAASTSTSTSTSTAAPTDDDANSLAGLAPSSTFSPAELDARRQHATDLIGAVEGVASVGWSTKSTLVIAVTGGNKAGREKIIGEVCKHVLAVDELRLTRLQVHEFEPETEADARVHWQQCK